MNQLTKLEPFNVVDHTSPSASVCKTYHNIINDNTVYPHTFEDWIENFLVHVDNAVSTDDIWKMNTAATAKRKMSKNSYVYVPLLQNVTVDTVSSIDRNLETTNADFVRSRTMAANNKTQARRPAYLH